MIDDTLPPGRATHVEACSDCREQAGQLKGALALSRAIDVPEPSPLFWDHFSARVEEAVRTEPRPAPSIWAWLGAHGLTPLVAVVALVLAAGAGWLARNARVPADTAPVNIGSIASMSPAAGGDLATVPGDDETAWAVLSAAAADMQIEDARAAGMGVHPGAVDRAVVDLSPAERNELGRLLQSELKRSSN
jgi:hypothetical protein